VEPATRWRFDGGAIGVYIDVSWCFMLQWSAIHDNSCELEDGYLATKVTKMSQVAFCVDSLSMTAGGIPWITSLTSGWHSTLHPRDWMSSWSNAPQRNGSLKRPKLERCEHPWFRVPNSLLTLQTLDTLRKCSIFPAETTTKTPQELAENRPSASMASVWENGRLGLPFDGGTLYQLNLWWEKDC